VVVKVSEGVYVFYGHMVRASTDLKIGDKVEIGQPLGRLGNSGNCDAPQLHLQIMDGVDPLRSNGIPWVFDRFILHGSITGYDHINGMIEVNYLTIQKEVTARNFGGDSVIGFE
jgi:murein DD-endopeptidase MepM/ murein hydrolase activator NlpD